MKLMMKSILRPFFILLITLSFTLSSIAAEYWMHPYATGANAGTLADPYYGDTRDHYDTVMANLATNSVIHILPGVYYSGGALSFPLKSGQRILGSGID